jgi:hypothetical protein
MPRGEPMALLAILLLAPEWLHVEPETPMWIIDKYPSLTELLTAKVPGWLNMTTILTAAVGVSLSTPILGTHDNTRRIGNLAYMPYWYGDLN